VRYEKGNAVFLPVNPDPDMAGAVIQIDSPKDKPIPIGLSILVRSENDGSKLEIHPLDGGDKIYDFEDQ